MNILKQIIFIIVIEKNNGKIDMIKSGVNWKDLGIPYILVYELIKY